MASTIILGKRRLREWYVVSVLIVCPIYISLVGTIASILCIYSDMQPMYFGETKRIHPKNLKESAWIPDGFGEFHYDGSIQYEGDFVKGKLHGQGRFEFHTDETSYLGAFYEGNMHGNGVVVTKKGRSLVLMRDNLVICSRDGNYTSISLIIACIRIISILRMFSLFVYVIYILS